MKSNQEPNNWPTFFVSIKAMKDSQKNWPRLKEPKETQWLLIHANTPFKIFYEVNGSTVLSGETWPGSTDQKNSVVSMLFSDFHKWAVVM